MADPAKHKSVSVPKAAWVKANFLKDKIVRTYVTHGAPSIPVKTLYLNSVKLRLVMGVYSFVFGWKLSHWFRTRQFFSVPFVTAEKRFKFLGIVKNDIYNDIKK